MHRQRQFHCAALEWSFCTSQRSIQGIACGGIAFGIQSQGAQSTLAIGEIAAAFGLRR